MSHSGFVKERHRTSLCEQGSRLPCATINGLQVSEPSSKISLAQPCGRAWIVQVASREPRNACKSWPKGSVRMWERLLKRGFQPAFLRWKIRR